MYKSSSLTDINHTSNEPNSANMQKSDFNTDFHKNTEVDIMDEKLYEEEKLQQQLAIEWLDKRIELAAAQVINLEKRTRRDLLQRQRRAISRGQNGQRFILQLRLSTVSGLQVTYKRLLEKLGAEKRKRVLALIDFQYQYASRLAVQVRLDRAQVQSIASSVTTGLARSVE